MGDAVKANKQLLQCDDQTRDDWIEMSREIREGIWYTRRFYCVTIRWTEAGDGPLAEWKIYCTARSSGALSPPETPEETSQCTDPSYFCRTLLLVNVGTIVDAQDANSRIQPKQDKWKQTSPMPKVVVGKE